MDLPTGFLSKRFFPAVALLAVACCLSPTGTRAELRAGSTPASSQEATSRQGQVDHSSSDAQNPQKTIAELATYMSSGPGNADSRLRQIGYEHPGISDEVWRSFTPLTQVETGYLSAESAVKGGGERML